MRDNEQSKIYGMKAENYFASLLNQFGIQFEYINEWFDFLVNKEHKVEVKSCQIAVKEGKASKETYRVGRFDLPEKHFFVEDDILARDNHKYMRRYKPKNPILKKLSREINDSKKCYCAEDYIKLSKKIEEWDK